MLQTIEDEFFNLLFADKKACSEPISEVEQSVLEGVQVLLYAPESFAHHVSMMPGILTSLIGAVGGSQVDFIQVVSALCEEPDVAKEILKIANSDMYRVKGKRDIVSINHATAQLGLVNAAYIGVTVLMCHVTRTKSNYFAPFSDLINKHSLQTSFACRDLGDQQGMSAFNCHILGLLNIVGMVYCFNCLSRELDKLGFETQPSPALYHQVCRQWHSELTVEIAKQWSVPRGMINALEQLADQATHKTSDLAEVLSVADILSKVTLLVNYGDMAPHEAMAVLEPFNIPKDYAENFFSIAGSL